MFTNEDVCFLRAPGEMRCMGIHRKDSGEVPNGSSNRSSNSNCQSASPRSPLAAAIKGAALSESEAVCKGVAVRIQGWLASKTGFVN